MWVNRLVTIWRYATHKQGLGPDTGVCASRGLECGVWLALTQFYGIQVITFMLNKLEIRSQIQFYFSKTHYIYHREKKTRLMGTSASDLMRR